MRINLCEESLKTAKIGHFTFIAVCVAVLAFGLSPSRMARYDAALQELSALQTLNISDLRQYYYDTVNSAFSAFTNVRPLQELKCKNDFRGGNIPIFLQFVTI